MTDKTTIHAGPDLDTNLDELVERYLDLKDRAEQIAEQMEAIKECFRVLGAGQHATTSGITITVQAPSRRFNLDRAWSLLTPEQQALCVAPAAAKVKAQLAPVLAEQCYDAGTGQAIVKVG